MSNHVYIILRDNKEKGPYSLEELLRFSFKPHDLIWVEGGASWRSPSEIEALKPYINIPENNPQKTVTNSSRIFISYPKNTQATTTEVAYLKPEVTIGNSTATLENEEEPTAESLEIKADRIYQRVLAYNDQKQQHQESSASGGIYTHQELTHKYALRHQERKKKVNIKSRKRLLRPAGIAGIIVSGLFFIIRSTTVENNTPTTPTPLYITNTTYAVTAKALNNVTPEVLNKEHNIRIAPIEKETVLSAPVTNSKELSVDEFIDSVRQVMVRQDRLNSLPRRKKY